MATKSETTLQSAEQLSEISDQARLGLERLIFFSDAVFAIAITLLALEIRLPDAARGLNDSQLFSTLLGMWDEYFAYVISFLVIGNFWVAHHRKFRFIKEFDGRLLLLNLLLLMVIAFIPFPSSVISTSGNRTATIFYALIMILGSFIFVGIWVHALRRGMVDPEIQAYQRKREVIIPLATAGVFTLSIGVAFLNDGIARLIWVLILPVSAFINRA